jgi:hypothetical protein
MGNSQDRVCFAHEQILFLPLQQHRGRDQTHLCPSEEKDLI